MESGRGPADNAENTEPQWPIPGTADLINGIVSALPGWVATCVQHRAGAVPIAPSAVAKAANQAAIEVDRRLRDVLRQPLPNQRVGPLEIVRDAVRFPTEVLEAAGVAPVVRDPFAMRNFPDDIYELSPAAFSDVHEDLHDLGIAWGAAKAWLHLQSRRDTEAATESENR